MSAPRARPAAPVVVVHRATTEEEARRRQILDSAVASVDVYSVDEWLRIERAIQRANREVLKREHAAAQV